MKTIGKICTCEGEMLAGHSGWICQSCDRGVVPFSPIERSKLGPLTPSVVPLVCRVCEGAENEICVYCDEGWVDCDCNCPHCEEQDRCSECNGSGEIVCWNCKGVKP